MFELTSADSNLVNVAAVMVTAKLPAFARMGNQIDVTVSSIGDAQSLVGGTLIATPMRGHDGQIYAMAQGSLPSVASLSATLRWVRLRIIRPLRALAVAPL